MDVLCLIGIATAGLAVTPSAELKSAKMTKLKIKNKEDTFQGLNQLKSRVNNSLDCFLECKLTILIKKIK